MCAWSQIKYIHCLWQHRYVLFSTMRWCIFHQRVVFDHQRTCRYPNFEQYYTNARCVIRLSDCWMAWGNQLCSRPHSEGVCFTSTVMIQIYLWASLKSDFEVMSWLMLDNRSSKAWWSHQLEMEDHFLSGLTFIKYVKRHYVIGNIFLKSDLIGWHWEYHVTIPRSDSLVVQSHLKMYSRQYVHCQYQSFGIFFVDRMALFGSSEFPQHSKRWFAVPCTKRITRHCLAKLRNVSFACDSWTTRIYLSSILNSMLGNDILGPDSITICHLTSIRNPVVEINRPYDRLISTVVFPIPVRHHYIESGPRH